MKFGQNFGAEVWPIWSFLIKIGVRTGEIGDTTWKQLLGEGTQPFNPLCLWQWFTKVKNVKLYSLDKMEQRNSEKAP